MVRSQRKRPRRVAVTREHFCWLLGLLMSKERRHIDWYEFARTIGISNRSIRHYVAEGRIGRKAIANKLMMCFRERGIMIHLEDFYQDEPEPSLKPLQTLPQ